MRTQIVVLASLITGTAYAERVGVVVTGEATIQPQLAAHLERWLQIKGRTVVPSPLEPQAINTLIDCFVLEDLACARGVVDARSKANAVVFTRADMTANADGTRDIAITGYWFQKEREAIAERRVCKSCNDDRLHATIDDLMHGLVHDPPLPREDARQRPPEIASEGDSARRWLPYGLIGAGSIALVSAGILIAIDDDPDPVGPQQPRYRDTATGGFMLGLAGAAAVGTGIYMWHRDRRSIRGPGVEPGPSASGPVAAVSSGGGYLGWAGRF